ncbi:glycine zipper 2TM domain-containing protein [Enterobacteriaceae bacterium ESL0689]|nr:glycine zipper 2TM domain-containing protein [Enterobacteriaceae bacterium ESL0689]
MILRVLALSMISLSLAGCVNDSDLAGDVYSASEAKQVRNVTYGTIVNIKKVKIQSDDKNDALGAIGGAVLGGFLGHTIGSGTGRSLATAAGAVAGGLTGQNVQGAMNRSQGLELEIRKDDGNTIIVVQKQGEYTYSVGQRVAIAGNRERVTVSPR